jgi:hypothetical protein
VLNTCGVYIDFLPMQRHDNTPLHIAIEKGSNRVGEFLMIRIEDINGPTVRYLYNVYIFANDMLLGSIHEFPSRTITSIVI